MHHHAELVRSVLRWALLLIAQEESSGGNHLPGPRISQFCLGNLLLRTDSETCLALARELAALEGIEENDVHLSALIHSIRNGWGGYERERTLRRTGTEDSIYKASYIITSLRNFSSNADRDLLENCAASKTWKGVEICYKGRLWSSIRDDFEKVARKFYLKESKMLCETAEYIMRLNKDKRT